MIKYSYKLIAFLSALIAILVLPPYQIVSASETGPDLVIDKITWSPSNPEPGDMVTFTVSIKNIGNEEVNPSEIDCYVDEIFQGSFSVSALISEESTTQTFTWEAQPGPHIIQATCDPNGDINEANETNNHTSFAFSVAGPDLVIESITWLPKNISVGDDVTFTVTIKNQGNLQARLSYADLY